MIELKQRAKTLGFKAIVANWEQYAGEPWLKQLIEEEEKERDLLSLERRIKNAHIGQFKPMSEFDWDWPTKIDRDQVEELLTLDFMNDQCNVVLVGTNGLGKSMIAQNLANAALSRGYKTRFVKASDMLNKLAQSNSATARERCLKQFCAPALLLIDELGYMNYDDSYADLLYEVISRRYLKASTVVTTNKGYQQWGEIFPNAGCVVTMVDRLAHKSEAVVIEGESYRQKEAMERAAAKERERQSRKSGAKAKGGKKND